MHQPYVIILANGLNGLGAVRSAAQAGLRIYTLLSSPSDLTAYSRYSKQRFLIPSTPTVKEILSILDGIRHAESSPGVLIACSDFAAELLGKLKTRGYVNHHLVIPGAETTEILNDKKLEYEHMAGGGIILPRTYYNLRYNIPAGVPLIIKPRTFREYDLLGAKNRIVRTAEELDQFRKQFSKHLDRFVAQEVIPGNDNNLWVCNVTFDEKSNLTACFIFRRLGTMPSHYGVTSLAISYNNEELRKACERIGRILNYTGPAMIEFKMDPETDRYYYIETNPRLGMCNWFDTCCGINNILACTQVAYDKQVAFSPQKNNYVYWNFFGDLIARIENRENPFDILKLYLNLLKHRRVNALMYWKDPGPALSYSLSAMKDIAYRIGNRLSRDS